MAWLSVFTALTTLVAIVYVQSVGGESQLTSLSLAVGIVAASGGIAVSVASLVLIRVPRRDVTARSSMQDLQYDMALFIQYWGLLELALRDIVGRQLGEDATYIPLSNVMEEFRRRSDVSADQVSEIQKLLALRNRAAHSDWSGGEPGKESFEAAIDSVRDLLDTFGERRDSHLPELLGNRLPLVREIRDPLFLGIHPTATLADVESEEPPFLERRMPRYVQRDIDAELRSCLRSKSKRGGLVLISGGVSSGKTRTAAEAMWAELPDWNLYVPAKRDVRFLARELAPRNTVVWLDDFQNSLPSADALTALLADLFSDSTAPRIGLGTIWTDHLDSLLMRGPDEVSSAVRELLQNAEIFHLSSRLSRKELEAAAKVPDPRIRDAVVNGGGALPRYLQELGLV